MKATIDKAGRLVIPAPLRAQTGLLPGTEVEMVIEDCALRILRAVPGPKLVRKGKRLVARPTAGKTLSLDVARLIEEERNRWPL